jgi:hypothetical protein
MDGDRVSHDCVSYFLPMVTLDLHVRSKNTYVNNNNYYLKFGIAYDMYK